MNNIKSFCLFACGLTLLLTSGGAVFAQAAKTMSGAACEGGYGLEQGFFSYDSGIFFNASEYTLWAVCDIVRDNSTNTTKPVDAFVRVGDFSETEGFSCTIASCNHLGTACEYYPFSTGVGSTGIASIRTPIGKSYYNGYYSVGCWVPPFSAIASIYTFEP